MESLDFVTNQYRDVGKEDTTTTILSEVRASLSPQA